ncbi:erythromycin esterase family protein [Microbacterium azadirachtae]|uniref:erythromycin esterase family protein n=1 Tax=Microbacterium azadirachtae TaxID=582680 RepID=UPI000886597E|nr:erythromycin esterase family protein [Microbacterium azadirachtae]SDL44297.1 erythromycin esterase [Microbacterium azadirachtae]SEF74582.1 erythromycin esterase [Microbacterium azadirachtae]SEF75416.1 erythromycin esterase [Microbacterium azadirachtae]
MPSPEDEPDALGTWIRDDAHSLRTLDPDDDDDSDLEPLADIVGDARVVAIGESMHRVHEFFALRHRLFRFLHRRAGFTALVTESGMPEGRRVDTWIRTGAGGLRDTLREGVTYGFGACQEMLDQLTWMRARAAAGHGAPRWYGMDLPDSSASALPGVLTALDLLDDVDPHYAAHARESLLPLFAYLPGDRSGLAQAAPTIQAYLALPADRRAGITVGIADLAARIRARRREEIDALGGDAESRERVDAAIRAAESARAADAFLQAMTAGAARTWPAANIRDAWMADTVEWILEREPRIVVAAANGHVQRTPFSAPPFVPDPMTTMCGHLADRLGTDLVVIGTAFGGGEQWLHRPTVDDAPGHSRPFIAPLAPLDPSSLDAVLERSGIGDALLDLRRPSARAAVALDATSGWHNGDVLQPGSAREAFDAVAFVRRVSPWHTWIDERGLDRR